MNTNKHIEHDGADQHVRPEAIVRGSRRRLIGGAAGGVGILMAVSAKTALGTTVCQSPSAMVSGNTSPNHDQPTSCSGGRSPGFWKQPQKFSFWLTAGATPPTFNVPVVECMKGLGDIDLSNIATPGTLVVNVLPGANVPPNTGIWAVLAFPNDFNPGGQLMRHLIAAWLNAGLFGTDYPITRQQIQDMWAAVSIGGVYCPAGMNCGTNGMTANDVIDYISSMYDYNADLDNDVCEKKT